MNEKYFARYWEGYADYLASCDALDYDDMLSFTVALLQQCPEVAAELAAKWRYVLADEFQDTNYAQYEFVRLLAMAPLRDPRASGPRSLLVVGDSDQSIYGWRGAKEHLLRTRLHSDMGPTCRLLSLPSNYRSTPQILAVADALLKNSPTRSDLRVRPILPAGSDVELWAHATCRTESAEVVKEIERLLAAKVPGESIAVLYRANWQSRAFESLLLKRGIRHIVVGGLAFYARREIKDLTCLLRLVHNPGDAIAFRRMANVPPRGLGLAALTALGEWAETVAGTKAAASRLLLSGVDGPDAAPLPEPEQMGMKKAQHKAFSAFRDTYARWRAIAATGTVGEVLKAIIRDVQYYEYLAKDENSAEDKMGNVGELQSAADAHPEPDPYGDDLDGAQPVRGFDALRAFLENAALNSADALKADKKAPGYVRLQTMHSSKGLEFHSVFAVGLEEGILPNRRAVEESGGGVGLEEERRTLYVACTRAKQRLYLSHAHSRRMFGGEPAAAAPSQFLTQIGRLPELVRRDVEEERAEGRWDGRQNEDATFRSQSHSAAQKFPPRRIAAAAPPAQQRGVEAPAKVMARMEAVSAGSDMATLMAAKRAAAEARRRR